jgi:hypothetical protein
MNNYSPVKFTLPASTIDRSMANVSLKPGIFNKI